MKTEKRTEIAERIKTSRVFGDLSENAEYNETKFSQAEKELRIAELEQKIRNAKVIDEKEIDTKIIQIGSLVKVHDEEFEEDVEYTIVGSTEVNLAEKKFQTKILWVRLCLEETVEVDAPQGTIKVKILAIKK